jgi:hypothetical protein
MKEEALLQVIQFSIRRLGMSLWRLLRRDGWRGKRISKAMYASLYDHKVGSQMRPIDDHLVVINNTYISHISRTCWWAAPG